MVNVKELLESEYISVDLIKNDENKTLVIVEPGTLEQTEYGNKLTMRVNFNAKMKIWRLNKLTIVNIAEKLGNDTTQWIGKPINLTIQKINGKEAIIGSVAEETFKLN